MEDKPSQSIYRPLRWYQFSIMRALIAIVALSILLMQGHPFYHQQYFDGNVRTVMNEQFWTIAAVEVILLGLYILQRWADAARRDCDPKSE